MSTEEIQSIRDALHRIEIAITGDPAMGHRGLTSRIADVEKAQEGVERKLLLWSGMITGAWFVLSQLKSRFFGG